MLRGRNYTNQYLIEFRFYSRALSTQLFESNIGTKGGMKKLTPVAVGWRMMPATEAEKVGKKEVVGKGGEAMYYFRVALKYLNFWSQLGVSSNF